MTGQEASYETRRAAALSGVPASTVYYWARRGIWRPAPPNARPKLWSYSDLLGLRLIDWLRQAKPDFEIPRTRMSEIRTFLASVEDLGEQLTSDSVKVWVESDGRVLVSIAEVIDQPIGDSGLQPLIDRGMVNLAAAYEGAAGFVAPDLVRPRPTLRIIPGRLSSEPHVHGTRVGSQMIDALRRRGISNDNIIELYSFSDSRECRGRHLARGSA